MVKPVKQDRENGDNLLNRDDHGDNLLKITLTLVRIQFQP